MSYVRFVDHHTVEKAIPELGTHERRLIKVWDITTAHSAMLERHMKSLGGDAVSCSRDGEDRYEKWSLFLKGDGNQFQQFIDQVSNEKEGLGGLTNELREMLRREERSESFVLRCGSHELALSQRTHVMGILNVTPDSFSDGGRYFELERAVEHGLRMVEEGVDFIDVGGESTRPGSYPVDPHEEIRRVVPVIEKLSKELSVPISIDTTKAVVAEAALDAGASLVNDISGLRFDERMASVVAKAGVPVILMHIQGKPKHMQKKPEYEDLMDDIYAYLYESIKIGCQHGIPKERMLIDPGIGFGKEKPDNFLILKRLHEFRGLGCPILIGVSRKSFIGWALDVPEDDRLMGTAAAVTASILQGAHVVRVHDVKEMVQVVRIADHIRQATHQPKDEG